jgi:glucosamine-6-phosphate deaminase
MKIIVLKNGGELVNKGVEIIVEQIRKKKGSVLGLATGKTMEGFYRELVRLENNAGISFKDTRTFNLDEYVGLSYKNMKSYRSYMDRQFFKKIKIKRANINFLNGAVKNLNLECKGYEELIKNSRGIDLQILGIGRNGHIGFNEPGSTIKSRTRVVELSLSTRRANARNFGGFVSKVPRQALTMGIGTIMGARKILVMAVGKEKAEAVKLAIMGKINRGVPASFLRKHNNVTFVLDESSARLLQKN